MSSTSSSILRRKLSWIFGINSDRETILTRYWPHGFSETPETILELFRDAKLTATEFAELERAMKKQFVFGKGERGHLLLVGVTSAGIVYELFQSEVRISNVPENRRDNRVDEELVRSCMDLRQPTFPIVMLDELSIMVFMVHNDYIEISDSEEIFEEMFEDILCPIIMHIDKYDLVIVGVGNVPNWVADPIKRIFPVFRWLSEFYDIDNVCDIKGFIKLPITEASWEGLEKLLIVLLIDNRAFLKYRMIRELCITEYLYSNSRKIGLSQVLQAIQDKTLSDVVMHKNFDANVLVPNNGGLAIAEEDVGDGLVEEYTKVNVWEWLHKNTARFDCFVTIVENEQLPLCKRLMSDGIAGYKLE